MTDRHTRHCSWRKVSLQCFRSYKWMKRLPGAWELLLAQRIQKIQNERWLWNVFSFSEILPCFWCSLNVPFIVWKLLIPLEDKTAAHHKRSELKEKKKGDICMGGTEVPLVSLNFLEEISSLSYSIFSIYFFVLIPEEGFLISPCYSLELCIQMGVAFLFSFAFSFSSFLSYL